MFHLGKLSVCLVSVASSFLSLEILGKKQWHGFGFRIKATMRHCGHGLCLQFVEFVAIWK